jgi:ribonuclease III
MAKRGATREERQTGLEDRLGHVFTDKSLLKRALTHVSAIRAGAARSQSYQRLEFLGDRVLGFAIARLLYDAFPDADEGELSRRLAELVRRETCAEVARDWEIGAALILGPGESQSGGRRKEAILSDACEAIIGAVAIDAGFERAFALVERSFGSRVSQAIEKPRDAKTELQEWAQGLGHPAPIYREIGRSGPDHAPDFTILAEIAGLGEATGIGRSKRLAEQIAAAAFLVKAGRWAPQEAALD